LQQVMSMYRIKNKEQLEFENFHLPFGGKLVSENRWVKLSNIIPWDELEDQYADLFSKDQGAPAKPFRMALGALIIKERFSITDEETVEHIRENHFLQYFIGHSEYSYEAPFDPSMMVHFRKRLTKDILNQINEKIAMVGINIVSEQSGKDDDNNGSSCDKDREQTGNDKQENTKPNAGTLMLDASVAPADIAYPTDLNLLNDAREKLEEIIDVLYEPYREEMEKPRTYRNIARRDYLTVAKKRKNKPKSIRKAIRKQLQYIKRDLGHIEKIKNQFECLHYLNRYQYHNLLVIHELYRQQKEMFDNWSHHVDDRIVSISQPHVRPIVRGKASANVEFGAKIVVSNIEGYAFLEYCSWDSFNEATIMQDQVEGYRAQFGCYPEVLLVDKLYRTRENIKWCHDNNIRISGPRLGRPSIDKSRNKKQEQVDSGKRNGIEGIFGVGKRKYSLGRIMSKLNITSESTIALILLIMNLEIRIRDIFISFLFKYIPMQNQHFSLES
jgi:transposase, IS5 family